jgi:hypothetical protein
MISPQESEREVVIGRRRNGTNFDICEQESGSVGLNGWEWASNSEPWAEFDIIEFRDPQRSSIRPSSDGSSADSSSSSAKQGGSAPPPDSGDTGSPQSSTSTEQGPEYDVSTRKASGKVDVTIEVEGEVSCCAIDAITTEDMFQKIAGHELGLTLSP